MLHKTTQLESEATVETPAVSSPINTNEIKAALTLQKFYRGHRARKKYHYNELHEKQQKSCLTHVLGNDPEIHGLSKYEAKDGQITLIGNSGVRSLLLVCQLGNKNDKRIIPKIILIDNSRQVHAFWRNLRHYANTHETETKFVAGLREFVHSNRNIIRDNTSIDDIFVFFRNLFSLYDFQYVRSIINAATLIRQNWENQDTFNKIRNVLTHLQINNVFVYSSNIVASNEANMDILLNIHNLKPQLSIHTDVLSPFPDYLHPVKVHLCEDQTPSVVAAKLYAPIDPLLLPDQLKLQKDNHYKMIPRDLAERITNKHNATQLARVTATSATLYGGAKSFPQKTAAKENKDEALKNLAAKNVA